MRSVHSQRGLPFELLDEVPEHREALVQIAGRDEYDTGELASFAGGEPLAVGLREPEGPIQGVERVG